MEKRVFGFHHHSFSQTQTVTYDIQYFVGFNIDVVDDDSWYDDDDHTKYTKIEQKRVTFMRNANINDGIHNLYYQFRQNDVSAYETLCWHLFTAFCQAAIVRMVYGGIYWCMKKVQFSLHKMMIGYCVTITSEKQPQTNITTIPYLTLTRNSFISFSHISININHELYSHHQHSPHWHGIFVWKYTYPWWLLTVAIKCLTYISIFHIVPHTSYAVRNGKIEVCLCVCVTCCYQINTPTNMNNDCCLGFGIALHCLYCKLWIAVSIRENCTFWNGLQIVARINA